MNFIFVLVLLFVSCGGKPAKKAVQPQEEPACKVVHYEPSAEVKERRAAIKVKPIDAITHSCPKGKHWEIGNYYREQNERENYRTCTYKGNILMESVAGWSIREGTEHDYDYAYCATDKQADK